MFLFFLSLFKILEFRSRFLVPIKSMLLLQNITDLITCAAAAIYNFSKIVKLLMAQRRGRTGGIRGNQINVGKGVEANPPVGRNGG